MKIGFSVSDVKTFFTEEEYFSRLKEIGYDALDYSINTVCGKPDEMFSSRKAWTDYYKNTASLAKRIGIEVGQTHATFATNFDGERRLSQKCLNQYKKEIEATAILGAPYIVIHPINFAVLERDKEENRKNNLEAFSLLEPTLREFDVKLGVEDMFIWDGRRGSHVRTDISTPTDMVEVIDTLNDTLGSDRFVACLDTGHMHIHAIQPDTAVKVLGKRTKLLHVHDNYGLRDNHNGIGQGITDWKALALALKEVGYDGVFSLEVGLKSVYNISPETMWAYVEYCYKASKEIIERNGL